MGGSLPYGWAQGVNDSRRVGATEAFVRANTALIAPPHVPEIVLHLADEAHDLWHLTEEQLEEKGLPPPFWAFAWAGGQALAAIGVDARLSAEHMETLRALPEVTAVRQVELD